MIRQAVRFLVGIVVICTALFGCTVRQVDWFLVEQASMAEASLHQLAKGSKRNWFAKAQPEFVITGHRIAAGDGAIIAYRAFSHGMLPLVDQAQFKKLTIFLPFALSDRLIEINLAGEEKAIAFWSNGSSNFPGESGCFGYASGGSIRLKKITNEEVFVNLSLSFDLVSPTNLNEGCSHFEFKESLTLRKEKVTSLTPWEGAVGVHLYDESIR